MIESYESLLARKERYTPSVGFDADVGEPWLKPFQQHAVRWALAGGCRALFEDTGLGKTRQELSFADHVARHTGGRVLLLAPLAVGAQTAAEATAVGLDGVAFARRPGDTAARVVIANYESLDHFDNEEVAGVVLDESSILKSYSGSTKRALVEHFASTPFRLAATATPAPNDHLELGNHAEFLGILSSHQMIARWFINDLSKSGKYRLKGHAVRPFWDWVSSWALCAGVPSDIGPYSDEGYVLPELRLIPHVVNVDLVSGAAEGALMRLGDLSATSVHKEKRRTVTERAARVAELVAAEPDEAWLLWCETDYEAEALRAAVGDLVEVSGPMSAELKSERLLHFAAHGGRLLTKPKIAGWGLNFQRCARMVLSGGTYSYEAVYQLIRRAWRFGQTRPVHVHIVMAVTEQAMWDVVAGKQADHAAMKAEMFAASRRRQAQHSPMLDYHPTHEAPLPSWLTPLEIQCSA